jgi:hypothetical protein
MISSQYYTHSRALERERNSESTVAQMLVLLAVSPGVLRVVTSKDIAI